MSLDQLRYFVTVAEEGSVSRAALRLHICQPPLSRQIRSLEDELGAALFLRTRRGVELLPPGRELLSRARRILLDVTEAGNAVRQLAVTSPCEHTITPNVEDVSRPITATKTRAEDGSVPHDSDALTTLFSGDCR